MKVSSVVAVAVLLVGARAQAIVAYNFPVTPDRTSASGSYELANIFQVGSQNISVTRVGAADYGAPGFVGTVPVAIYSWSVSQSQWNQVAGTYHDFTGTPSNLEGGASFYTLPSAVLLNAGGIYAIFGANFGSDNPYWSASGTHTDINGAATFGGGSSITMGAALPGGTYRGWYTAGTSLPGSIAGGTKVNMVQRSLAHQEHPPLPEPHSTSHPCRRRQLLVRLPLACSGSFILAVTPDCAA